MQKVPFVDDDRCAPQAVRFTDAHVIIDMTDGRILSLPMYFFPWLQNATVAQRQNYRLNHFTVDWADMDEGIDMVAMLTGLYRKDKPRPVDVIQPASATTT